MLKDMLREKHAEQISANWVDSEKITLHEKEKEKEKEDVASSYYCQFYYGVRYFRFKAKSKSLKARLYAVQRAKPRIFNIS